MEVFKRYLGAYEAYVKDLFTLFNLDLVIYDEIENFRDYESDQF